MREKITAANWKMNLTKEDALSFVTKIQHSLDDLSDDHHIILGAPYVFLDSMQSCVNTDNNLKLSAQNMHQEESGAFTGEISHKMLKSIGVDTVILGHSERRTIFDESQEIIQNKINRALEGNMRIILCCGEPLEVRKKKEQNAYIKNQLESALQEVSPEMMHNVIIAYEPIWAIGTGESASPNQAQKVHNFIRTYVSEKYNIQVADDLSILYGGSVKPHNAEDLFSMNDIDGGLVGGASLQFQSFSEIINIHNSL